MQIGGGFFGYAGRLMQTPGAHYAVTPNPEIVEVCREDGDALEAVNGADLVLADVFPLQVGFRRQEDFFIGGVGDLPRRVLEGVPAKLGIISPAAVTAQSGYGSAARAPLP